MTPLDFIDSIDWGLLSKQKAWLADMADYVDNPDAPNGLLSLVDSLQGLAVEHFDYTEEEVFGELDV